MYCSWIGKICIFVTMINSQDKILQKTERMISCGLASLAFSTAFHRVWRCMGRQENVGADHAALAGVVTVLTVILAVQLFPGTIGGRRHGGLSGAAFDLGYMKMI